MTGNSRGRLKEYEQFFFLKRNESVTQLRRCATRVWRHIQFTERPVTKLIPKGRRDKVWVEWWCCGEGSGGEDGRWWCWGLELWSMQHGSDTKSERERRLDHGRLGSTTVTWQLTWQVSIHANKLTWSYTQQCQNHVQGCCKDAAKPEKNWHFTRDICNLESQRNSKSV